MTELPCISLSAYPCICYPSSSYLYHLRLPLLPSPPFWPNTHVTKSAAYRITLLIIRGIQTSSYAPNQRQQQREGEQRRWDSLQRGLLPTISITSCKLHSLVVAYSTFLPLVEEGAIIAKRKYHILQTSLPPRCEFLFYLCTHCRRHQHHDTTHRSCYYILITFHFLFYLLFPI